MKQAMTILALAAALAAAGPLQAQTAAAPKPTIVLVHGAFADASSWNGVIADLERQGYPVIAAANPLRSVAGDGAAVAALVGSIRGPVVLVGHSYGGPVITTAAKAAENVKALVFVSAFAPEIGESVAELSGLYPGSTLGEALEAPVPLPGGGNDLYIAKARFHAQFAADVPETQARLMAATQRPVAQAALDEESAVASWKTIASWSIYGDADRNIPPAVMAFMADRAHARRTVVVRGASHSVMVSHPHAVAALIQEAANGQ